MNDDIKNVDLRIKHSIACCLFNQYWQYIIHIENIRSNLIKIVLGIILTAYPIGQYYLLNKVEDKAYLITYEGIVSLLLILVLLYNMSSKYYYTLYYIKIRKLEKILNVDIYNIKPKVTKFVSSFFWLNSFIALLSISSNIKLFADVYEIYYKQKTTLLLLFTPAGISFIIYLITFGAFQTQYKKLLNENKE